MFGFFSGAFGSMGGWGGFLASATLGGVMAKASGGKFWQGFVSAGVASLVPSGGNPYATLAVKTIVGGTVSELTGGKFANGAVSAAFAFLISSGINRLGNSIRESRVASQWIKYSKEHPAPKDETPEARLQRLHKELRDLGYGVGIPKEHELSVRLDKTGDEVGIGNAAITLSDHIIVVSEAYVNKTEDADVAFTLAHEYIHVEDMISAGVTDMKNFAGAMEHYQSELRAYQWQIDHASEFGFHSADVRIATFGRMDCYKSNINSLKYSRGYTAVCE